MYLTFGFICVGLGALGAALPVLPTVPFLLAASWCFARGSRRYHTWFCGTRLYRKHLQEFAQSRSMTLRTKLSILLPVTGVLLLARILVSSLAMRICLGFVMLAKYWYFIFRIKTIPKSGPEPSGSQTINL